jgi:tetratricopeptide (TPR) repeat protein
MNATMVICMNKPRPSASAEPGRAAARRLLPPAIETAWLPGTTEVPVAGETFHADAILAAQLSTQPNSPLVAVLLPEPTNTHDPHAVAIYLNREHVGYLPRSIAAAVQPALLQFAASHAGQAVSCPARVNASEVGAQVVLLLNTGPLGMNPGAFEALPDLDASIWRLLPRLDMPALPLAGYDPQARAALTEAEAARAETEANYQRAPEDWPRVEKAFRRAAERLGRAEDSQVAAAWLGVARSTRYQKGRRDDTLAAFVEALRWDRANADAWCELLDMSATAPHIPTLVALFVRIPLKTRPLAARQLLTLSRGQDRLGKMSPSAGERLRAELLSLAEAQGDTATMARLTR